MKYLKLLTLCAVMFSFTACLKPTKIADGSVVRINYKGTFDDGKVFDTTEGKQPLAFIVGTNQVLPAFEEQVTTMKPGQTKKFKLNAKKAYGAPDPKKVVTLPRDGRFQNVELKEGAIIFANNKAPNGQVVQTPLKVLKVSDTEVTMDYNHPLAGKDLNFEVTLVDVREPAVQQPGAQPQPAAAPQAQPAAAPAEAPAAQPAQ